MDNFHKYNFGDKTKLHNAVIYVRFKKHMRQYYMLLT